MQFFILLAKGTFLPGRSERSTKLAPRDYELAPPPSRLQRAAGGAKTRGAEGRGASNQRFTICQPSGNKLSEFYPRPV